MKVGWCQWNGGVAWRCQGAASRGGGSATRDCQTKHTAALPCTCHDRAGHSANQGHIAGRGNSWGHVDHSETVTGRAARPDYWVVARYQRPHDDLVLQMTDVKALYGHNRRRQPLRVQSMAAVTAEPPPHLHAGQPTPVQPLPKSCMAHGATSVTLLGASRAIAGQMEQMRDVGLCPPPG
jgi:hypothetical protein